MKENMLLDPPIPPTIQIVVDCHGQPIAREALRYVEHIFGNLVGSDRMLRTFWVTRHDFLQDFYARIGMPDCINRQTILSESRHEPSFDMYEDGGIVPVARLVNLAPPKPFDMNFGLKSNEDHVCEWHSFTGDTERRCAICQKLM